MSKSEKILVIEGTPTNKIKIKGSQFIGYAYRISNTDEANNKLADLKKEFYDATHHCYAYLTKEGAEKYSDDGEPNGTAGIRLLNAINHFSLTDILIVVIRYYGGTKLGVGPLGKAYGETALDLLENVNFLELTKFEQIKIEYSYDELSSVHYLLNKFNCKNINNLYDAKPIIEFCIEPYQINEFGDELIEKTAGNVQLERINKEFYLRLKQK